MGKRVYRVYRGKQDALEYIGCARIYGVYKNIQDIQGIQDVLE